MNTLILFFFFAEMIGNTYTRADLLQMQENFRKQNLIEFIEYNVVTNVCSSAREGKTHYFWTKPVPRNHIGGHPNRANVPFTNEELIEVLKEKFPDTTVEYQETWVETRPGVKEERKGILIDWS